MYIRIHYEPSLQELARASSLFIEKKPFIFLTVGFINLIAGLFTLILIFKLYLQGLLANEWLALVGAMLWLWGRRPFSQWLLQRRMKHSRVLHKPITIEISLNGISWSGKGLLAGNIAWQDIKYLLETKNGFIIPNRFSKFLWVPFRGFKSTEHIQQFQSLISEKKIKHLFTRRVC